MAGKIKTQLIIEGKDNTGKAFKGVDKNLNALTASAKKAGVAIATALSVNALSGYVKNSLDAADAASKSAQATGLAVDEYTALQYAANLAGVGVSELDASLSKFNRTIDEAASGSTSQVEAFARLGVSITDAGGNLKSNSALFAEVADKFQAMPNGIQKSALAMELFGRSGARLIPLLNGWSAGLAELRAEAEKLGVVLYSEQAAASEAFNDNLTRLGEASKGAGNQIAGELLPTLLDMSELMVDVTTNTGAMGVAADVLGGALKILATAAVAVGSTLGNVGRLIGATAAAAVAAAKGEFTEAATIMSEVTADNEKATKDAEARIAKLWDGSGEAAAKAAADQKAIAKSLTAGLKEEQDAQVKNAKTALAERVKLEKAAAKALDDAKSEQLATEKRYKDALANLNAGAASDPTYGAALDLKVAARQALGSGDIEQAKTQAQASLKIIQDLTDAGANTYGFAGFIKELQGIEQSADQINVDKAQASFDAAAKSVVDLKAQIDQVKTVDITPTMDPAAAAKAKADVQTLADELNKTLVITPTIASPQASGAQPAGFATGGHVRGPGTGTSDSIMARLSNGEYVMRAAAVRQYGTSLLDKMNGLRLPKFADGGLVSAAMSAPVGGSSFGTVNLNLDGHSYQMQANEQNFAELVWRQKQKRGSTRSRPGG